MDATQRKKELEENIVSLKKEEKGYNERVTKLEEALKSDAQSKFDH